MFGISEHFHEYRERLGHYQSSLSELLRGAVRAVIDYVQAGYRSFTFRQEGDIKRYMNGHLDKEKAADTVYNASLPFLNREECERVKGQLFYIVQSMKEELLHSRSRSLNM